MHELLLMRMATCRPGSMSSRLHHCSALARYRVLFNTLLDGQPGVEEGLVVKDSPFVGSKKFGMCFVDNEGRLASIGGCVICARVGNVPVCHLQCLSIE